MPYLPTISKMASTLANKCVIALGAKTVAKPARQVRSAAAKKVNIGSPCARDGSSCVDPRETPYC